jgi:endonuclease III
MGSLIVDEQGVFHYGGLSDNEGMAQQLANIVKSLSDFEMGAEQGWNGYGHMGATITDAILQAGVRWDSVVWPRVKRVRSDFPEAKTTSGFLDVAERVGLEEMIRWKHPEKIGRIMGVARFLVDEHVETEEDLKAWLSTPGNDERLRSQRGIGPKTVDYFRLLAGISTAAIDRHLMRFLAMAGIEVDLYEEARDVVEEAAAILKVPAEILDHSIWRYMARRRGVNIC